MTIVPGEIDGGERPRKRFKQQEYSKEQQEIIEQTRKALEVGPGRFEMLDKTLLKVDLAYQREATSREKIQDIAEHWSWIACAAIVVGHRLDKYYVIDGDYRTLAAHKLPSIKALPCIVFDHTTQEQEAQAFLYINAKRRPMTSVEMFKSKIIIRDECALVVKGLLDEYGYEVHATVTENAQRVKCVKTLTDWAATDRDILLRMWPLMVEAAAHGPIHQRFVDAIMHLQRRLEYQVSGDSLLRNPWRDRLIKLGSPGILQAVARAHGYHAKGGARTSAIGLHDALNRGVRNKLDVSMEDESKG